MIDSLFSVIDVVKCFDLVSQQKVQAKADSP